MATSKIYVDPNEDVVFTFSKVEQAPSAKVALIVPEGANIISSQVSLKLLSRMLAKGNKLSIIVTEDDLGQRYATRAGLVTVDKVSSIQEGDWQAAHEYKKKILELREAKKAELVNRNKDNEYQIIDKEERVDSTRLAKLEAPKSGSETVSQTAPIVEPEPEPLFKKLEPKVLELEGFALISGGDLSEQELELELRERVLQLERKHEKLELQQQQNVQQEEQMPQQQMVAQEQQLAQLQQVPEDQESQKAKLAVSETKFSERLELAKGKATTTLAVFASKAKGAIDNFKNNRSEQGPRKEESSSVQMRPRSLTNQNFAKSNDFSKNKIDSQEYVKRRKQLQKEIKPRTAKRNSMKNKSSGFARRFSLFLEKLKSMPRTRLASIGAVGMILLILVFVLFSSPTVTLSLDLKEESIPINQTITASEEFTAVDSQATTIPMQYVSKDSSRSETAQATGEGETGEKSSGEVRIFNYTSETLNLSSGTTLTSVNNNRSYVLLETVTVDPLSQYPSDVPIEAADFGEEFDLTSGKKDFQASGYSLEDVSIFSYSGVSGGSKEAVSVVSQEDIDQLREQLVTLVRSDLETQLNSLVAESELTLNQTLSYSEPEVSSSREAGAQGDTFDMTVSMSVRVAVINKQDLNEIATDLVRKQSSLQGEVAVKELQDPVISEISVIDGGISFNIQSSAIASAAVTEEELTGKVLGIGVGEAKKQLSEDDGIDSYELEYSPSYMPSFLRSMPDNPERIELELR